MLKKSLGILISFILIVILLFQINLKETIIEFTKINIFWLLFLIPTVIFSLYLRSIRWQKIINQKQIHFKSLFKGMILGFSANYLLPFKLGEVYRSYYIGKKENISKTLVFSTIILERIFDGIAISFLFLVGIYFFHPYKWLFKVLLIGCGIFLVPLIILFLFYKIPHFHNIIDKYLPNFIKKYYMNFRECLHILNNPVHVLNIFGFSLIIWLIESISILLVLKSFGILLFPAAYFLILGLVAFSTLIPSGPASIGPFQYGYIVALAIFKINMETAVAASLINQICVLIVTVIPGIVIFYREHLKFKI